MDFDSAVNNFNQALLGSAQMIAASNTSHEDRRLIREQNDLSRQWNEKEPRELIGRETEIPRLCKSKISLTRVISLGLYRGSGS